MIYKLKSFGHLEEGYSAYIPISKQTLRHPQYEILVKIVKDHLKENGQDPNTAEYYIQQTTGEELYKKNRIDLVEAFPEGHLEEGLNLKKIASGAEAAAQMLWRKLRGLSILVPLEVAEKRAEICAKCKINGPVYLDKSSLKAESLIAKMIGEKRSTRHDSKLNHCQPCKCRLSSLVHFDAELMSLNRSDAEFIKRTSPQCWKLKEVTIS